MSLKILIIHESSLIKEIIYKYFIIEHPDALIDLSFSPQNSLDLIDEVKYDLIFSGLEMATVNGLEILSHAESSELNDQTPVIVMTSTNVKNYYEKLFKQGIKHVLQIPCTFIEFRNLVTKALNLKDLSSFPKAKAIIYLENKQIWGKITSFEIKKILFEIILDKNNKNLEDLEDLEDIRKIINLEKSGRICVFFPIDYGRSSVIKITGDIFDIKTNKLKIEAQINWNLFEFDVLAKKSIKMSLNYFDKPIIKENENEKEKKELYNKAQGNNKEFAYHERLKHKYLEQIDKLNLEKQELFEKIFKLEQKIEKLSQIQNIQIGASLKDVPLSVFINESAKKTSNSAKISIFKTLIDENIKLRK